MNVENETQVAFAVKHGKNKTDAMTEELLAAIRDTLVAHGIEYGGKNRTVKPLGDGVNILVDGEWRLLFDVINPDETFDHVEFKVTKTGWCRSL